MYILHQDGTAFGPFDWKLVRFLHALKLIDGYYVNEEGSEIVILASESPKFIKHPTWTSDYISYLDGSGFTHHQCEIFRLIGLPPFTGRGHRYVGNKIISMLAAEASSQINPELICRAKTESSLGWKSEPATSEQKKVIRNKGIRYTRPFSKGEASCIIGDPATEAQYRQLAYYGIGHIRYITKIEAAEILVEFETAFPDSGYKAKTSKLHACDDNTHSNSSEEARSAFSVYIYKNDEHLGPLNSEQIQEMFKNREVFPDDLAWKEGYPTWVPLANIFHVFQSIDASITSKHQDFSDKDKLIINDLIEDLKKKIEVHAETLRQFIPNLKLEIPLGLSEIEAYYDELEAAIWSYRAYTSVELNLIEDLKKKIEVNAETLRQFNPTLKLEIPLGLSEMKSYCHDLQHAVDSYLAFTIEELENEIFYDMGNGKEYMFSFAPSPTEKQLHQFKLLMLEAYFKKGRSENFNHLAVVKKAFPGVKFERMDC